MAPFTGSARTDPESRIEGSELFTAWVALSDVTAEAGPMRFVRGSHGWGLLDDGGFYRQDLDDQRDAIPVPDQQMARCIGPTAT